MKTRNFIWGLLFIGFLCITSLILTGCDPKSIGKPKGGGATDVGSAGPIEYDSAGVPKKPKKLIMSPVTGGPCPFLNSPETIAQYNRQKKAYDAYKKSHPAGTAAASTAKIKKPQPLPVSRAPTSQYAAGVDDDTGPAAAPVAAPTPTQDPRQWPDLYADRPLPSSMAPPATPTGASKTGVSKADPIKPGVSKADPIKPDVSKTDGSKADPIKKVVDLSAVPVSTTVPDPWTAPKPMPMDSVARNYARGLPSDMLDITCTWGQYRDAIALAANPPSPTSWADRLVNSTIPRLFPDGALAPFVYGGPQDLKKLQSDLYAATKAWDAAAKSGVGVAAAEKKYDDAVVALRLAWNVFRGLYAPGAHRKAQELRTESLYLNNENEAAEAKLAELKANLTRGTAAEIEKLTSEINSRKTRSALLLARANSCTPLVEIFGKGGL